MSPDRRSRSTPMSGTTALPRHDFEPPGLKPAKSRTRQRNVFPHVYALDKTGSKILIESRMLMEQREKDEMSFQAFSPWYFWYCRGIATPPVTIWKQNWKLGETGGISVTGYLYSIWDETPTETISTTGHAWNEKTKHTNPYQLSNERNNIRPDSHTNNHSIVSKPKGIYQSKACIPLACQSKNGPIASSDHQPTTLGVQLQSHSPLRW